MVLAAGPGCVEGGAGPGVAVTKVTDGDTVHVEVGGRDERVRLIGIDAPEVPWYGGPDECFGSEAGLYARGRLDGRSVRLEYDRERRDRFGRLLAYVYLGEELFNLTLVRLGYARSLPVPPNVTMSGRFAQAEREARASSRGLWSACSFDG
jgi:micrococcal nuclease